MSHVASKYNSLPELLEENECAYSDGEEETTKKRRRYWIKVWKRHIEKHGNVPLIQKCTICSGQEQKIDIKKGRWKPTRPTKNERDEAKGNIK